MKIIIQAGSASKTTTGVARGVDVSFVGSVLRLDGATIRLKGGCTLLPAEDGRPVYARWGEPDNWVDRRTLDVLRGLDRGDYRSVLDAIETACAVEVGS